MVQRSVRRLALVSCAHEPMQAASSSAVRSFPRRCCVPLLRMCIELFSCVRLDRLARLAPVRLDEPPLSRMAAGVGRSSALCSDIGSDSWPLDDEASCDSCRSTCQLAALATRHLRSTPNERADNVLHAWSLICLAVLHGSFPVSSRRHSPSDSPRTRTTRATRAADTLPVRILHAHTHHSHCTARPSRFAPFAPLRLLFSARHVSRHCRRSAGN